MIFTELYSCSISVSYPLWVTHQLSVQLQTTQPPLMCWWLWHEMHSLTPAVALLNRETDACPSHLKSGKIFGSLFQEGAMTEFLLTDSSWNGSSIWLCWLVGCHLVIWFNTETLKTIILMSTCILAILLVMHYALIILRKNSNIFLLMSIKCCFWYVYTFYCNCMLKTIYYIIKNN